MRTLEKTLCVLAVTGYLFILLFWQGGEMMAALSLLILSIIYLMLGFALLNGMSFAGAFSRDSYKGIPALNIAGGVFIGILLALICFNTIFGVLLWTAYNYMLTINILLCLVIIVISAIYRHGKNGAFHVRILTRVVPFAAVCVLLLVFSPRKMALKIIYREHPAYIEAMERYWEHRTPETAAAVHEEQKKLHNH